MSTTARQATVPHRTQVLVRLLLALGGGSRLGAHTLQAVLRITQRGHDCCRVALCAAGGAGAQGRGWGRGCGPPRRHACSRPSSLPGRSHRNRQGCASRASSTGCSQPSRAAAELHAVQAAPARQQPLAPICFLTAGQPDVHPANNLPPAERVPRLPPANGVAKLSAAKSVTRQPAAKGGSYLPPAASGPAQSWLPGWHAAR